MWKQKGGVVMVRVGGLVGGAKVMSVCIDGSSSRGGGRYGIHALVRVGG